MAVVESDHFSYSSSSFSDEYADISEWKQEEECFEEYPKLGVLPYQFEPTLSASNSDSDTNSDGENTQSQTDAENFVGFNTDNRVGIADWSE